MNTKVKFVRSGEACGHPGCLSHRTHACEGCGRTGGQGDYDPNYDFADAQDEADRAQVIAEHKEK